MVCKKICDEEQHPFYTEVITYLFGVFIKLVLNHKNDFNR